MAETSARKDWEGTEPDELARLRAENEALQGALVAEREENLWNAYHTGNVVNGRWTHMFMSDGEWLAQECGFDPKQADYDDEQIKAAIPLAARKAMENRND